MRPLRDEVPRFSEDIQDQEVSTWTFWKRRRYLVAVLAFFGFFNACALRMTILVALEEMTERITWVQSKINFDRPEFEWDANTKDLVLSSFYYGYIVTQLPGGWLANKYGGNKIFAIGIGGTALLSFVTPSLAKMNSTLLIAVRIIGGLFEGVTYPCIYATLARWAPPLERSRLVTIAFSGSFLGMMVSLPLSGILARNFGWPSIFYVFGTAGLIWFAVWWWIVKEGPELDPIISPAELKYIQDSLDKRSGQYLKTISHPWKDILTSPPVWAIAASHFSENWGPYTLLTFLPAFLRETYSFQISNSGLYISIFYLGMTILMLTSGYLADFLQRRKKMTTTNVRKLFCCSALVAQTMFMLLAGFSTRVFSCCNLVFTAVAFGGIAWSGFSVNNLDIAPQYASILMGISNTVATLPAIISPLITREIQKNPYTTQWKLVFFISSGVYLFGSIIYGIWASGERQYWAIIKKTNNELDPNERNENE